MAPPYRGPRDSRRITDVCHDFSKLVKPPYVRPGGFVAQLIEPTFVDLNRNRDFVLRRLLLTTTPEESNARRQPGHDFLLYL